VKAAKVILNQLNPIDAPTDQDRAVITRVTNRARERLADRGIEMTNADIQATLWYPEKDLWAKMAGEDESKLKQSYDKEFIKLAEERGLGNEARSAADRVTDGAGASRAGVEPAEGQAQGVRGGFGGALRGEAIQFPVPRRPALSDAVVTPRENSGSLLKAANL